MKKKDSKKKTLITVIVMITLVVAVAIAFWNFMESKRAQNSEKKIDTSNEVQMLLDKDFGENYPSTPREIVKMYSRISVCLHNRSLSDEDQKALVNQMRSLFDQELLDQNPYEKHIKDLQNEIKEYNKKKETISNYTIDENSSVEKSTVKGKEYASLCASYLIKEGNTASYAKTNEKFILRADEKGNWKILGWELIDSDAEE